MTYLEIDEKTIEGKKIIGFLKTQSYIRVLDKTNAITRAAIQDARAGRVKKAKNTKDLFKQILGWEFIRIIIVTKINLNVYKIWLF